jgi:hypothetical protein
MEIKVKASKASRIRAALQVNPNLTEAELSAQLGIMRKDIRAILDRNPIWHRKTVNRSA